MHVFVDESIHANHGFMLVVFVLCSNDPQQAVTEILQKHGAREHHSRARMDADADAQQLRSELLAYLLEDGPKWAVHVLPSNRRLSVTEDVCETLSQIEPTIPGGRFDSIWLDQGLGNRARLQSLAAKAKLPIPTIAESHSVCGIQLADLVAGLCGVRLREELSGNPKMLRYGSESGDEPPIDGPLGFELWAKLRNSMHRSGEPLGDEMPELAEFATQGTGLFLSPLCSNELRSAAMKIFGSVYLGCIH